MNKEGFITRSGSQEKIKNIGGNEEDMKSEGLGGDIMMEGGGASRPILGIIPSFLAFGLGGSG